MEQRKLIHVELFWLFLGDHTLVYNHEQRNMISWKLCNARMTVVDAAEVEVVEATI